MGGGGNLPTLSGISLLTSVGFWAKAFIGACKQTRLIIKAANT